MRSPYSGAQPMSQAGSFAGSWFLSCVSGLCAQLVPYCATPAPLTTKMRIHVNLQASCLLLPSFGGFADPIASAFARDASEGASYMKVFFLPVVIHCFSGLCSSNTHSCPRPQHRRLDRQGTGYTTLHSSCGVMVDRLQGMLLAPIFWSVLASGSIWQIQVFQPK